MSECENLILRFRDLSTADGETVALHNAIARAHEYVWWGWWHKGGEQVPFDEFAELLHRARSADGLGLFLLDSGHGRTYRALCKDIKWDAAREPVLSPEPEKTPEYYRGTPRLAWFKLGPIEPFGLDPTRFTYVRVDKFFSTQPSKYGAFYGKRIFSTQELIQQNRSIWFVREALQSDPAHQVTLFGAPSLTPEHFPATFQQSGSRNLLWVSDLHYSPAQDGHHGFALARDPARKMLGQAIEAALKKHGIDDLGGVLVSGDITWKASPDEFNLSLDFFKWMESWADLDPYQFAVCPGNHDVAFTARADAKDAPIEHAFDMAKLAYATFYSNLFNQQPNEHLSCGRRYLLGNNRSIEVVCLNSSKLEQRKDLFQGHGFVGDEQLDKAAESFGWDPQSPAEGRPYRIVMLHHHLVPVTYREQPISGALYSVVLDAEALVQWVVRHRVDLVLHGHMHQPSCVRLSRPVQLRKANESTEWHNFHVLGLGSTGVARRDVGAVGRNTFGVLSFNATGLEVTLYSVSPTDTSEEIWSVLLPYPSPGRGI